MKNAKTSVDRRQGTSANTDGIEPLALSVEDAAKAAGIGRTALYDAIRTNELASLKKGRRRLIRVETLKAWLASLEQRAVV